MQNILVFKEKNMRVGDIIVNPHVNEYFKTKPNPMCKSIIIHIDPEYTTTLRYDGKTSLYFTSDVKEWKVLRNIDLCEIIFNTNDTNAFFNFDRVIEIEKKKSYNQALEDVMKIYNEMQPQLATHVYDLGERIKALKK